MTKLRHKFLIRAMRITDQLILAASLWVVMRPAEFASGLYRDWIRASGYGFAEAAGMVVLMTGWVFIHDHFVRYRADRFVPFAAEILDFIKATGVACFWLMLIALIVPGYGMDSATLALFFGLAGAGGAVSRLAVRSIVIGARRSGYNYRNLLLVGVNDHALSVAKKILARPELGFRIVGFVAEGPLDAGVVPKTGRKDWPVLGTIGEMKEILERESVDEIMACLPIDSKIEEISQVTGYARDLGVVMRLVPGAVERRVLEGFHFEYFDDEFVITLFRERMIGQLFMKRVLDVVLSSVLLLVMLPVFLVTAVCIKVSSGGPVFFMQERVGLNKRTFRMIKFRSMRDNAEEIRESIAHLNEVDGPVFKIQNDPRVTDFGKFLRRSSLDELPQLFNVLRGEMSLVGPRPPLPEEVDRYEWMFRKRLSVKPGMTCIWQISGRSDVSFARWMRMDQDYVENWSLWLDLQILMKTIPAVLTSRGAC
jgi:exopolysaccharide biosynthesis polyprenyl glycosylphosphotransferase